MKSLRKPSKNLKEKQWLTFKNLTPKSKPTKLQGPKNLGHGKWVCGFVDIGRGFVWFWLARLSAAWIQARCGGGTLR